VTAPHAVPLRRLGIETPVFVDIHSHVVPSGDDGVRTHEEGLALCAEAAARGTRVLFATPHASPHYPLTPERERRVRDSFEAMRAVAPLELRLGFEVTPAPEVLDDDPARYALEGTDLFLVDAPLSGRDVDFELLLSVGDHARSAGLRPVLAHPEEWIPLLNDRRLAGMLIDRGWTLQVGRRGLFGHGGRIVESVAWSLVQSGAAGLVASDGHRAAKPPFLDALFALVAERLGRAALPLFDGSALEPTRAPRRSEVPALERLRELSLLPEGVECVFVSGSTVTGWAHARSDVDVYVVAAERPPLDGLRRVGVPLREPEVLVAERREGGTRWEIQYWLPSQVEALVAKAERGAEGGVSLASEELAFYHRLAGARAIAGADWLRRVQERLAASRLPSMVLAHAREEAESFVDDAEGLVESGDLVSATLCARKAFGRAVDALLVSKGDLSLSERWRGRRLQRVGPPELGWDRYWAVETLRDYDPDAPRPWLDDTIALTRELLAHASS
jgi:tyrosine-protein phosphatase YwqE/predicted nucleotidyltransferase